MMTRRTPILLLTGILTLAILLAGQSPAASPTPDLPQELVQEKPLPTLVEFYAEWCGTCRKMLPILHEIQSKTEGRLRILRFDIDDEKHESLVEHYRVNGTPTYYLYDRDGKPIYKMANRINSELLKLQAYKTAGISNPVLVPGNLPGAAAGGKPYTLVQFHKDNCKPCTDGKAFGNYLEKQFQHDLAVIELNHKDPAVREAMKKTTIKQPPGYILLDRDGYSFIQLTKPLTRQDKYFLWQYFQLIQQSEP